MLDSYVRSLLYVIEGRMGRRGLGLLCAMTLCQVVLGAPEGEIAENGGGFLWLTVFAPEPSGHGSCTRTATCLQTSGDSCLLNYSDAYTIEAHPDSGWRFDFWWINGVETDSNQPLTRHITSDMWILPVFSEIPDRYWLTVFEPEPSGHGTVTTTAECVLIQQGSILMDGGQPYVLTANPDSGWAMDYWWVNGTERDSNSILTRQITSDTWVMPVFKPINRRWLTVFEPDPSGSGTVTKTANCVAETGESCLMDDGDTYTLQANPGAGWAIDYWWVNGTERDSNNTLIRQITSDTWVMPVFKETDHRWLTVFPPDPNGSGTVTRTANCYLEVGDSCLIDDGDSYTLQANPNDGWVLEYWWVNGEEMDSNDILVRKISADTWVLPVFRCVKLDLGDGVTLELVKIPPGSFQMGTASTDGYSLYNSSRSVHTVTFAQPFYIGKYEVTQAQWRAVMGTSPSYFTGDNRPVENITYADTVTFCQQLEIKIGRKVRLPSEAEWEYACKAGGGDTKYYFGDDDALLGDYAWFYDNSGPEGGEHQTQDVGTRLPNAFGLYDMLGNVYEYCQDLYHWDYTGAPTDGSAWTTGGQAQTHIVRGGEYYTNPLFTRSAYRGLSALNDHWAGGGFRIAAGTAE